MYLPHGNGRRLTYVFTLLVASVLLLAACGGADPVPTIEEPVDAEPEPTETEAPEPTEMAEPTATAEPTDMAEPEETEPAEAITPAVTVEDQMLEDSTVTVPEVVSDGPGWMVIHADDGGAPGPVIGHTAVTSGQNSDVAVEIDTAAATETLYAMLHVDAGTEGTYEFPGDDAPATVDGEVVVLPFQVSGLDGEAADETTAEEEAMEVPEEAVETTEIAMENIAFAPQVAVVEVGDTVTWTNNDAFAHTVTAGTRDNPTDLFSSGNVGNGETFTFTFEEAGTYEYFCTLHPGMAGTVIVQ